MLRELGILVSAKGASKAAADIGKVDSAIGRLGKRAGQGLRNTATNLGKLGAIAAVGIGAAVKGGLQSLAELESATTSVDGAIKQMGLTGQLTGAQVAGWANEIEASIGAAFDDKEITAAATTLLRFGHTTPGNLKPALTVMTDLATKTGSVDSAASLLAKALADPTKAAGKLARSGVILTKAEQAQIKAMVKAGDTAGAQKLILDSLAKSTKGAALASQGPYARSLSTLKDVTEDAQKALAEGFLPVIEKVRDILSGALANPANIQKIRDFGKGLASGLDSLVTLAKNLPWAQIGDSFKLAGEGAKTVLGIFSNMPPWVQTAILTGWGLNKLSGGALGGIFSSLASGLIKGVLGMNAAVVNINAGVVNGAGGVGGAAGAAGGAVSKLKFLGGVVISAAVLTEALSWVQDNVNMPKNQEQAGKNVQGTEAIIASKDPAKIAAALDGVKASVAGLDGLQKIMYDLNANGVKTHTEGLEAALASALAQANASGGLSPGDRQDAADAKAAQTKLDRLSDKMESSRQANVSRLAALRSTTASGSSAIVAAIHGIRLNAHITVPISVSVRGATASATWLHRATTLTKAGIY